MSLATAILVGAGSGERLRLDRPKAFTEVGGEALLIHAVRAFLRASTADRIVVVVGSGHAETAGTLLADADLRVDAICVGGERRSDSVRCGLASAPTDRPMVAVHDVARPLVSSELIDRTVRALVDPWDAVAPAMPLVDTVKQVEGDRVVRTVDRGNLRAVQTPQVFRRPTLERLHAGPPPLAVTDDLALVEQAGGRVRLVEGERRNFKVTYPEDLTLAAALLRDSPV